MGDGGRGTPPGGVLNPKLGIDCKTGGETRSGHPLHSISYRRSGHTLMAHHLSSGELDNSFS